MKKSLLVFMFGTAVILSSCFLIPPINTGANPLGLAKAGVDIGLTNNRPEIMMASTRVAPPSVTTTVPLPSIAPFDDGIDFQTYASNFGLNLKDIKSWTPCYGFASATVQNYPSGATLPNKISLSSVSVSVSIQDGVSPKVSIDLKTNPANAVIEFTKGTGDTYTVSSNQKVCVTLSGESLAAINTILSKGGKNTISGNLTYTVNQDATIGGTPKLNVIFDDGESTLVL